MCVQDYSWSDIRCPFEKRRDATAVFWDNVVYILGGSQLFPIKRMDCYNVLKDSWYSKLGTGKCMCVCVVLVTEMGVV